MSTDIVVLDARDVHAGYVVGSDIVRGVTLKVHKNEILCILGPNGSGKSTLVKSLFGFVKTTSGRVLFCEADVTGTPPHKMVGLGVGYVPQTEDVFGELTIEENLFMGAITARREVQENADWVYGCFPVLANKRRQRAGLLSGGERRLVGVGRALMTRPRLLLLDEPSAGLSPANVSEVFARLDEVRKSGVAIALVEQNAVEALALADTGFILDQGRESLSGPADDLMQDPRVRDLYLGLSPAPSDASAASSSSDIN